MMEVYRDTKFDHKITCRINILTSDYIMTQYWVIELQNYPIFHNRIMQGLNNS